MILNDTKHHSYRNFTCNCTTLYNIQNVWYKQSYKHQRIFDFINNHRSFRKPFNV